MAGKIVYYLGSLARMGLQKRKFLIYFRRPVVFITEFASALMYMDCMHAVMLKPASVHFTFISGYGYLI